MSYICFKRLLMLGTEKNIIKNRKPMSFQMLHVKSLGKLKAVASSKNLAHFSYYHHFCYHNYHCRYNLPCSTITTKLF